jgi:predicted nuclease of predicted toxin-antitoxin system
MVQYLIDANLPYYFSVWHGPEYQHVFDINDEWRDSEIWLHAREHDLTIVSKDSDFTDRALLSEPPPRVIHVRLGNMKMRTFHQRISEIWDEVRELSLRYRVIQIFEDRIEAIE